MVKYARNSIIRKVMEIFNVATRATHKDQYHGWIKGDSIDDYRDPPRSLSRVSSSWLKDRHKNVVEFSNISVGKEGLGCVRRGIDSPGIFPFLGFSSMNFSFGERVDRCAITYSRIRGDDLSSSVRSLDPLADRDIHRINRFLNFFFSLIPPIIPYPPEFFRDLVSFEDHDNTSDFLPQDGRKKLKDEIEIRDDWNDLSKMRIIGEKKWFFIPSSIRNIERQEAH